MRFLRSYGLVLILLAVVGGWMITGTFVQGGKGPGEGEKPIIPGNPVSEHHSDGPDPHLSIAERNDEISEEQSAARSVRTKTFTIQQMPLEVSLRGQTEASSIVPVVAQTSAIVEKVHVTKGQEVKVGDLMCELDVSTRAANVAQAKANLSKAQLDYDTNAQLRAKGFSSENSAAQMEVALETAKASLKLAEAELERTKIVSPIDGIVQGPITSEGNLLGMGAPCANVVDLDTVKFTASIPEARIALARTGLQVSIETISGQKADGTVTYISSIADAATRSYAVEVEAPNPGHSIRDGMTATATVNMGILPAHLLPQSALTLDDDGVLGVRAVKDSKVVFHAIEIIQDSRDGIWVTGLPPIVDVITLGQEDVRAGQIVEAGSAPEMETAENGAAS